MKMLRRAMAWAVCLTMLSVGAVAQEVRVYVNGMRLNQPVILQDGYTYAPLRALSESLGAQVSWDDATQSAYITFTEDDAIAKVVEDVSPSVVTIIGNYDNSAASVQYNNPTMHGTGVIYKNNGYIVTNAHVVEDIKNLTVVLSDGTLLPGKILYTDELADLAIVKIEKIGLKPITMASPDSVVSGKTAIAIGTPISLSMRNSVTKGIVSGAEVALRDSYYKLIQTDATINPGNSGGPLLNIKGELIGINTSKYADVSVDNMAFAIPVDTVSYVISQFEQYGKVIRPELSFSLEESWEAKIGLPTAKGITVKASADTRLINGDVIYTVNGIAVHSIADWNEAIKATYNGSSLGIGYQRGGQDGYVEITF